MQEIRRIRERLESRTEGWAEGKGRRYTQEISHQWREVERMIFSSNIYGGKEHCAALDVQCQKVHAGEKEGRKVRTGTEHRTRKAHW